MDLKFKDNSKLKLPLFTQLEYIESTGTQYIDTGISFPNGFRSVTKLYPTNVSSYKDYAGAYQSQLHNIHRIYDGKWNPCTQNNSGTYYGTVNANTLYTVDMSNANSKFNLIVNGSTLANDVTTPTGYSSLTCWIFALHRTDTTTDYQYYYGRIYEISLYDENNVLKFHGIPACDTNNVVCMYDTVLGQFFYNQGTGDFIAGPIVNKQVFLKTTTLYHKNTPNIDGLQVFLKTTTLYHKNTPNIDGLQLLNDILDCQKTHQEEIKEYYYSTTQLWQDIITEYPDIIQYYNMNHKLCIIICEADDPEQFTEDLLEIMGDYPDIVTDIVNVIAENPEVVHSLIDTGYETVLTSSGTQYIDTEFKPNQDSRAIIEFKDFESNSVQFGCRYNSLAFALNNVSNGKAYYGTEDTPLIFQSNSKVLLDANKNVWTIGSNSVTFSQTTFSINYNIVLFGFNNADTITKYSGKIYSCKIYDNDTFIRWLVPIQNNGNPCMIDLLTGTKYLNQGAGSFIYSLEPKNV